jgi:hypothetical protein
MDLPVFCFANKSFKKNDYLRVWWCTSVVPAVRKLGYLVRPCVKNQKKTLKLLLFFLTLYEMKNFFRERHRSVVSAGGPLIYKTPVVGFLPLPEPVGFSSQDEVH